MLQTSARTKASGSHMKITHPLGLLSVLVLVSCSTPQEPLRGTSPPQLTLAAQYNQAVAKAAIYRPEAVKPLTPIVGECSHVVSWMPAQFAQRLTQGTVADFDRFQWVSVEGELRAKCASARSEAVDLRMRLQQFLGLPPTQEDRKFVILQVRSADLFRPCLDSDIRKTTCDRANYPEKENLDHERWMLRQLLSSYNTGENGAVSGYPWTGLGYTFDWGSKDGHFGVSEYVLRKGAKAKVLDVISAEQYCDAAYRIQALTNECCVAQHP